jgi:hypothetical protein
LLYWLINSRRNIIRLYILFFLPVLEFKNKFRFLLRRLYFLLLLYFRDYFLRNFVWSLFFKRNIRSILFWFLLLFLFFLNSWNIRFIFFLDFISQIESFRHNNWLLFFDNTLFLLFMRLFNWFYWFFDILCRILWRILVFLFTI